MSNLIPLQMKFSQELPEILGNVDYRNFKDLLIRINEIIKKLQLDEIVMQNAINNFEEIAKKNFKGKIEDYKDLANASILRIQEQARCALRFGIARHLTGESYRKFSAHIADSPLLQNFCLLSYYETTLVIVPGKSTLQRAEKMVSESIIRQIVSALTKGASQNKEANKLELENPINIEEYYLDTTCVKVNIHFPVDWVLLRDATRTLTKSINLIRNNGLKNRMINPNDFMKQMNKLSIMMTHSRRKKDSKKERKRVLRLMKKLVVKVEEHAKKHKELLEANWQETKFSEAQKQQIIMRINKVVDQLPVAIHQAHERIIGERKINNKDKIFSLYERETQILIRGKAGAEVEFGNNLLLGEQANGLIIDWKMYKGKVPADVNLLPESLSRINKDYGQYPKTVTTDRGFYSIKNVESLAEKNIKNHMCPRAVNELQKQLKDEDFCNHQKRRSQTESRIGILKNNFLGTPIKSKGFHSRELEVAWSILAHNLWVLARLPKIKENENIHKLAA